MKMQTKIKMNIILLAALLLVPVFAAGCKKTGTTPTSTDVTTGTTTQGSSETTTETTTTSAETTPSETTTAPSETTTAGTTTAETAMTVPSTLNYAVLPANKTVKADLNDDGVKETLYYSCLDDYSFNLTLNGTTTRREGENFMADWFFLVNLDTEDRYMDIAVQELGPSDDYQVTFFYFNGSDLVFRGVIPGEICDPGSLTIQTDPFGTGTIQIDGIGGLVARARSDILCTWFYDEPWQVSGSGLLVKSPAQYYAMKSYDPDTGEELPDMPVKMKKDLPLVSQPGGSEVIAIARSGQDAALIQTDNREWVQLRTQSGVLGWFRVSTYHVLINGVSHFSDDVFDGLSFAD